MHYPEDFPRNQWYVAAQSAELGVDLISRTILGDPICMYRTEQGAPVAMIDQCLHRQMPLSMGRRTGDSIQCGYHGIVFDSEGRGVRIPGQSRVPSTCRVRTYPLFEKWGMVWIWPGQPELADESLVPDHHWFTDPGWATVGGKVYVDARAQLVNENLLDLSHVTFLHPETIGTEEVADTPTDPVEFTDAWVRVERHIPSATIPPFHSKLMDIEGLVEREQHAEWFAPGFHITHLSTRSVTGGPKYVHKAVHMITPETNRTTHYFWAITRDYRIDSDEVSRLWVEAIPHVFRQDIDAVEAIEKNILRYAPDHPVELNIAVDGGPLRCRKIMETLIAEERGAVDGTRNTG
ncbi:MULTISPECIES: aromatic ring-hydroxylating dioxygenase subunit alpha [unclassified Mycobacterium]|uniref:aromatic ring-hydroxylating dioxygenase subunit alpha n=1 Tax=unclassified Mycobacterium TaxID=2642494 RepID=UPI0029C8E0FF|nr:MULTISPECIES: aromatic ring-hydroxylating dioxygenase subunit alpha [unclassified Mycobacterium]